MFSFPLSDYVLISIIMFVIGLCVYLVIWYISSLQISNRLALARKIKMQAKQSNEAFFYALKRNPLLEFSQIKHLSGMNLVDMIQNEKIKCVDLLYLFFERTIQANEKFNFVTEFMFAFAIEKAKKIDSLSMTQKKELPLCGLPISMKDCLNVAGFDTTNGLAKYVNSKEEKHALIVELFLEAGAIPFIKTNVPQTLLSFECVNPLFGRTVNPFNVNYTSGGSSGGEAVALATLSVPVGIGTDIGGSLRIPAHFCGIMSLKPTSKRLSGLGIRKVRGQEIILGSAGPMGRSVEDLVAMMRVWLQPKIIKLDSHIVYKAFDEAAYASMKKIKIGYFIDDDFLAATPACQRAVLIAVEALKHDGHSVELFYPPKVSEIIGLYYSIMSADSAKTLLSQVDGEVWEPMVTNLVNSVLLPDIVRFVAGLVYSARGDKNMVLLLNHLGEKKVNEYFKLAHKRNDLKEEYFKAFQARQLDILICPGHIMPAIPNETFAKLSFTASVCMMWNLLDFPAGQVPITTVFPSDKIAPDHYSSGAMQDSIKRHYNPKDAAGLPVGVQVVGLPYEEEKVLRVMSLLEKLVPFDVSQNLEW